MDQRRERFRLLYEAHAPAVLAYGIRRLGREEARDVVAETFLVAWRRLDEVPDHALPWLYGVARKVIGNLRRSRSRARALQDKLSESAVTISGPDHADEVDARLALRSALDRLSEWDREALALVAWERLTNNEAASVMGCSPATFGVRLHRARRRLHRRLETGQTTGPLANLVEEAR